jgi:hypothetical protein
MDVIDAKYYDACGETGPVLKEILTRRVISRGEMLGELFESTKYKRNGEPTATSMCFVPATVRRQ